MNAEQMFGENAQKWKEKQNTSSAENYSRCVEWKHENIQKSNISLVNKEKKIMLTHMQIDPVQKIKAWSYLPTLVS